MNTQVGRAVQASEPRAVTNGPTETIVELQQRTHMLLTDTNDSLKTIYKLLHGPTAEPENTQPPVTNMFDFLSRLNSVAVENYHLTAQIKIFLGAN